MLDRLSLFSAFVQDLTGQARDRDVPGLLSWAVRELSDILGFDCAWYGWAQIKPDGPVIHASTTYNLPEEYYRFWTQISSQDLLVKQFLDDPKCVPTYDRRGEVHTDGMQGLSDKFGLKSMATAMNLREGRSASLWVSAYRGGENARPWTAEECEFLQCAIDQMASAARLAASTEDLAAQGDGASIFFNERGVGIVGLTSMQERFGHIWSRQDGDCIPRFLAEYIDQPGEHLLIDRGLVAICEKLRDGDGLELQKMTLRPLRKFDLLTPREQQVARVLASGKSHKETARDLGVAPSTIRNQTQSIYSKLGVDNRANLAASVPSDAWRAPGGRLS